MQIVLQPRIAAPAPAALLMLHCLMQAHLPSVLLALLLVCVVPQPKQNLHAQCPAQHHYVDQTHTR